MRFSEIENFLSRHKMDFAQFLQHIRLRRCAQTLADARYNDYSTTEIARMYASCALSSSARHLPRPTERCPSRTDRQIKRRIANHDGQGGGAT
jgi:hypothetical protein